MSLVPDMMPAWELREHLKHRDAQITALRAEVERLNRNIESWKQIPKQVADVYEAENERLRAALRKAEEELAANGYRDTQWPRPDIRAALEEKP